MHPRQNQKAVSPQSVAYTQKVESPWSMACTTLIPVWVMETFCITTWEQYRKAQTRCYTIWKYLERKGGVLEQKIIDMLFRQITILKEVLLDAKWRIQLKYEGEHLKQILKTKEGCTKIKKICDDLEKKKQGSHMTYPSYGQATPAKALKPAP